MIPGVEVFQPSAFDDHRGSFIKVFDAQTETLEEVTQTALSVNPARRTLRGMHYQARYPETKLVYCVRGRIFDVAVDLRADSPAFCQWFGIELSAESRKMLRIPAGCAHGFLTLEPNSEVLYHIAGPYLPTLQRAVAWNDPAFNIEWPETPTILSDKDRSCPPFDPQCASC